MNKNLPWIIVTVVILIAMVGLHFVVFAPMHNRYKETLSRLDEGISKLKGQIETVEWNIPRPDPRDPSFTWEGLRTNVKGNFDGKMVAYQNLVEDIAISLPADEPEKSKELVLTRLAALQELEKKNGNRLQVSSKWGLNTWSDQGHNNSRPLDLRAGEYRSYAGEQRIDGKQGTISFAINVTPWAEEGVPLNPDELTTKEKQEQQAQGPQMQVLFHAGKEMPPAEDAPKGAPPQYSSEIKVTREGTSINIVLLKKEPMNEIVKPKTINIADWLTKKTMGNNPWKVVRFSWGPVITDVQAFVDGKTVEEFNSTVRGTAAGGFAGGGMLPGMGMGMGMRMMGGGYGAMMGGEGGYGGGYGGMAGSGQVDPNAGVTFESFDAFTVGCDLQYNNPCPLMYDSLRIWNSVAKSGEPQSDPLFSEDYEAPFGSDTELKRSVEQLTRFYNDTYDPANGKDVQKTNKTWYTYMLGFWGSSPGLKEAQPEWVSTMKTLAFLDHAAKKVTKSGDPERFAKDIGVTPPEHLQRRHVATFLDLSVDMANAMLDAQVDQVNQIDFLTWSNTVNDEPLKAAYKEAFTQLETDVGAGKGSMGMGMGMGMGYGMGMGMGMGMGYGMGMPGMMPGMGYGMPGMMPGMGYGGMPYGGGMGAGADGEAQDPEALKAAEAARKEAMETAMKEMEERMQKMQQYEENLKKWKRWVKFNKRNEIPPEFYTDYQGKMVTEGKDFFLRYSVQTTFECSKDRLAPILYAIEYGKRLAFVSKVRLDSVPDIPNQINAVVNIEFNFMKAALLEEEKPVEGGEPEAIPGTSTEEQVQTSDVGGEG
jgi:hypothetical protein